MTSGSGGQPCDGELQDENHAQWSEMATERFADVLISGGNHDAVQSEEAQEIVKALHRGLAIVRAP